MAEFFKLNCSTNIDKVGFVPQVYNGIISNVNDPNSLSKLDILDEIKPETIIPQGILSAKAKKTDLISTSFLSLSDGLFVSEKLSEILMSSAIYGIQKLETKLISKNKKEDQYFLIRSYLPFLEGLDFNSTTFCYTDSFATIQLRSVSFKNSQSFFNSFFENRNFNIKNSSSQNEHLQIDSINILSTLSIDFFCLFPTLHTYKSYFVSEALKDKIEQAECTGIVFSKLNERYP